MEHRCGERHQTSAEAFIYCRGQPRATVSIDNFSRSGMYLKTGFRDLRLYQLIEIELNSSDQRSVHRFPAGVVRVDRKGVGVEVDYSDGQASAAVAALRDKTAEGVDINA